MIDQPVTKRPKPVGRRVAVALFSTVTVASVGFGALVAQADAGDPAGTIRTVVGTTYRFRQGGFHGDGGPVSENGTLIAQVYNPRAVAFGPNGDIFIADALNQRVRKISGGVITTVAGSSAIDSDTNQPVKDSSNPEEVAGPHFAGDGGQATSAHLWEPHGLAVDSAGNLYISDSRNNRIRKVDTNGIITTFITTFEPDIPGDPKKRFCRGSVSTCDVSDAAVKFPKNMFMDRNPNGDNLYVSDSGHDMVRKINIQTGKISTVAGSVIAKYYGGDGGPATDAQLNGPEGVWVTPNGDIYIADSSNNLIRKVDGTTKRISTIAGDKNAAFDAGKDASGNDVPGRRSKELAGDSSGDGGDAAAAHLNKPRGIAVDASGNVYIAEEQGARIRRINPSGKIHTIGGDGHTSAQNESSIQGDPGPSPATQAQFNFMHDLKIDGSGNLWIADSKNNRVRVIYNPANAPTTELPGTTPPTTQPPAAKQSGYWMLGNDGKVFAFGDAKHMGDISSAMAAGTKAVHIQPTPTAKGYWILDDDGNVYAFGDAVHAGGVSSSGVQLVAREKVTSLSGTPSGKGYWIFTTRGRVLTFGDAVHKGDMSAVALNGPVRGSIATPSGNGYYMVASDGGIFAFGDANFMGSMGGKPLNAPVESLVPTRDNAGYWLVASDGGIFAFGNAPFLGSMGGQPLNKPVTGMVRYGSGYMMVAADGGIFNYSDRPFAGSLGSNPPAKPVVFAATLDS